MLQCSKIFDESREIRKRETEQQNIIRLELKEIERHASEYTKTLKHVSSLGSGDQQEKVKALYLM